MPDAAISYKIVDWFFDKESVVKAVERGQRKALSKAGAFIRTRARSSIRRRKKVSQPGQPPSAHSTDAVASIKNILFGYDPENQSVVIGPVKLNSRRSEVPNVLEFGGEQTISEKRIAGRWVPVTWQKRDDGDAQRTRKVQYKARPFMGPALAAEAEHVAGFFVNTVQ